MLITLPLGTEAGSEALHTSSPGNAKGRERKVSTGWVQCCPQPDIHCLVRNWVTFKDKLDKASWRRRILHPPQPGLYKRIDSGGSKEKTARASLCFTPHPQLIPFTHPKLCLFQFNRFRQFPARQDSLRSLGSIYPWWVWDAQSSCLGIVDRSSLAPRQFYEPWA